MLGEDSGWLNDLSQVMGHNTGQKMGDVPGTGFDSGIQVFDLFKIQYAFTLRSKTSSQYVPVQFMPQSRHSASHSYGRQLNIGRAMFAV
jgi:hypothetical protein